MILLNNIEQNIKMFRYNKRKLATKNIKKQKENTKFHVDYNSKS